MTKTSKKTTTTPKIVAPAVKKAELPTNLIGLNDSALKAIAVFASATMFQAPQFTNQTNPQNILGLADLMYKYMSNEISVTQPESTDASKSVADTGAKFA